MSAHLGEVELVETMPIDGSDDECDRIHGDRENKELVNATSETSSIIVELSLDSPICVGWLSPSWKDIMG